MSPCKLHGFSHFQQGNHSEAQEESPQKLRRRGKLESLPSRTVSDHPGISELPRKIYSWSSRLVRIRRTSMNHLCLTGLIMHHDGTIPRPRNLTEIAGAKTNSANDGTQPHLLRNCAMFLSMKSFIRGRWMVESSQSESENTGNQSGI